MSTDLATLIQTTLTTGMQLTFKAAMNQYTYSKHVNINT